MPFIPVPNVIQANVRYTYYGQRLENTLYFQTDNTVTAADVSDVAVVLLQGWAATVMTNRTADLFLREVYAFDLTTASGPNATATFGTGPLAGSVSQAGLPGNIALAVSFRTAQRGRSFRGRIYLPGWPEPSVLGNTINNADLTTAVNGVASAIGQVVTTGRTHVVVSRYANNVPRAVGVATPVTIILATDATVDSQRRRLTGRGV